MRGRRFMDELMAEVILYGGLPVRRSDAYDDALKRITSRWEGQGIGRDRMRRAAELYAFGPNVRRAPADWQPLTTEELEALP